MSALARALVVPGRAREASRLGSFPDPWGLAPVAPSVVRGSLLIPWRGGGCGVGGFHPVRVSRDRCDLRIHMSHAEESLVQRGPRDDVGRVGPDWYASFFSEVCRRCLSLVSFRGAWGPGVSAGEGSSGTPSALRPVLFPCDRTRLGCSDSCWWLPLVSVAEAEFPPVCPPPPSVELLALRRVTIARFSFGSPVLRGLPASPVPGPGAG